MLKWINLILGISVLIQFLTGLIMGPANVHFLYELHNANAWILLFFIVLHVAHNWNWIKANVLTFHKERR